MPGVMASPEFELNPSESDNVHPLDLPAFIESLPSITTANGWHLALIPDLPPLLTSISTNMLTALTTSDVAESYQSNLVSQNDPIPELLFPLQTDVIESQANLSLFANSKVTILQDEGFKEKEKTRHISSSDSSRTSEACFLSAEEDSSLSEDLFYDPMRFELMKAQDQSLETQLELGIKEESSLELNPQIQTESNVNEAGIAESLRIYDNVKGHQVCALLNDENHESISSMPTSDAIERNIISSYDNIQRRRDSQETLKEIQLEEKPVQQLVEDWNPSLENVSALLEVQKQVNSSDISAMSTSINNSIDVELKVCDAIYDSETNNFDGGGKTSADDQLPSDNQNSDWQEGSYRPTNESAVNRPDQALDSSKQETDHEPPVDNASQNDTEKRHIDILEADVPPAADVHVDQGNENGQSEASRLPSFEELLQQHLKYKSFSEETKFEDNPNSGVIINDDKQAEYVEKLKYATDNNSEQTLEFPEDMVLKDISPLMLRIQVESPKDQLQAEPSESAPCFNETLSHDSSNLILEQHQKAGSSEMNSHFHIGREGATLPSVGGVVELNRTLEENEASQNNTHLNLLRDSPKMVESPEAGSSEVVPVFHNENLDKKSNLSGDVISTVGQGITISRFIAEQIKESLLDISEEFQHSEESDQRINFQLDTPSEKYLSDEAEYIPRFVEYSGERLSISGKENQQIGSSEISKAFDISLEYAVFVEDVDEATTGQRESFIAKPDSHEISKMESSSKTESSEIDLPIQVNKNDDVDSAPMKHEVEGIQEMVTEQLEDMEFNYSTCGNAISPNESIVNKYITEGSELTPEFHGKLTENRTILCDEMGQAGVSEIPNCFDKISEDPLCTCLTEAQEPAVNNASIDAPFVQERTRNENKEGAGFSKTGKDEGDLEDIGEISVSQVHDKEPDDALLNYETMHLKGTELETVEDLEIIEQPIQNTSFLMESDTEAYLIEGSVLISYFFETLQKHNAGLSADEKEVAGSSEISCCFNEVDANQASDVPDGAEFGGSLVDGLILKVDVVTSYDNIITQKPEKDKMSEQEYQESMLNVDLYETLDLYSSAENSKLEGPSLNPLREEVRAGYFEIVVNSCEPQSYTIDSIENINKEVLDSATTLEAPVVYEQPLKIEIEYSGKKEEAVAVSMDLQPPIEPQELNAENIDTLEVGATPSLNLQPEIHSREIHIPQQMEFSPLEQPFNILSKRTTYKEHIAREGCHIIEGTINILPSEIVITEDHEPKAEFLKTRDLPDDEGKFLILHNCLRYRIMAR